MNRGNEAKNVQNIGLVMNSAVSSEEFIDNEIYRLVLNGRGAGGVPPPPGLEAATKEALENEELAKRLETFEIETDTEMSMLNTDENTSASDSNDEDNGEGAEVYEDQIIRVRSGRE
jgi:hypothetical protein